MEIRYRERSNLSSRDDTGGMSQKSEEGFEVGKQSFLQ